MVGFSRIVVTLGLSVLAHSHGLLIPLVNLAVYFLMALVFLLLVKQEDILYIPQPDPSIPRENLVDPAKVDMPFENVELVTKDEVRIHGWLIKQSPDDVEINQNACTIIYFHGNAGNISNRLQYYLELWEHCKVNILAVDYRGYGNSDGYPSQIGLQIDAETFLNFARNHPMINRDKLFLYGRSLGGAVAIDLAAKDLANVVKGLIVENTFLSIPDVAFVLYPFLRLFKPFLKEPIIKSMWLSKEKIKDIACPILFISGAKDELIPPEHMRELYKACRHHIPGTRFISVPEGTHNETPFCAGIDYYRQIDTFCRDICSGNLPDSNSVIHNLSPAGKRRDTGLSEASFTDDEDFHMFS